MVEYLDPAFRVEPDDQAARGLQNRIDEIVFVAKGLLRLCLRCAQPDRRDAVRKVVRKFDEKPRLGLGKRIRHARVDRDRAERFVVYDKRNAYRRRIAPFSRLLAPRQKRRVGLHVAALAYGTGPDRGARGTASAVGVGPGQIQCFKVSLLKTRMRHRFD